MSRHAALVSWTWPVLVMMTASACITAQARVELTHRVSRLERIAPSAPLAAAIPANHIAVFMRDGTRHELGAGTVNIVDDLILVDRGDGTKVHFTAERAEVESLELSQSVLRRDGLGRDSSAEAIERPTQRDAQPQVLRAERTNYTGAVLLGVVGGVLLLGAILVGVACADGCFGEPMRNRMKPVSSRASRRVPRAICLVGTVALIAPGCVTASTTLGEVDRIEEVQRLVPSELDATPLRGERIEIVGVDGTRRTDAQSGHVFRMDDMLVVRALSGVEELIPLDDIASVDIVERREVRHEVQAKSTNSSGLITVGVLVGMALLLSASADN